MMLPGFGIDFLAVGAHADDVELGCGATVAKLCALGRNGVILDLTDASMGTRGTPEERLREADAAARILGVPRRLNLGLRDGFLTPRDPGAVASLVAILRELRPRVVFVHPRQDRHPDHEAAADLVHEAVYKAGLRKYPAEGAPFRPPRLFHYLGARSEEPDFVVDVSDWWTVRLRAVAAYVSQFATIPGAPATPISEPGFFEAVEARARYLGFRSRCRYAEGFHCAELPEIADPCTLSAAEF